MTDVAGPNSEQPAPMLRELLLMELRNGPPRKLAALAVALGADRSEVQRCLTHDLAGKVRQGADYKWRLVEADRARSSLRSIGPGSELARLCGYFLACIGQDMDEGASTFARSDKGPPSYAELPCLPWVGASDNWYAEPRVATLLAKVRSDQRKLVAWVGYPVRLRRHRTASWEGFFVEPILLWRIDSLEQDPALPRVDEDVPVLNGKFLRTVAMGDGSQLAEEAARLTEELGLNLPLSELPDAEELVDRLVRIRPEWDWREPMDPRHCSATPALSELDQQGIYNRAIVVPGERSPYTSGLESELKALAEVSESALSGTALGKWLAGGIASTGEESADEPLIEALPMNSEQRAAVRSALSSPHTVVTGPPGTGKSQVVTNLLINAAWRGMKVLFASKNNKAVDVVEERVNALGSRPVLLRLGAGEYQERLANYLTKLLAGSSGPEDQANYDDSLARHRELADSLSALDRIQQQTLDARNTADRLDAEAEEARRILGRLAPALTRSMVDKAEADMARLETCMVRASRDLQGAVARLAWSMVVGRRLRELSTILRTSAESARALGLEIPQVATEDGLAAVRAAMAEWKLRMRAARDLLAFKDAAESLEKGPSFEDIARQRAGLSQQLARNSVRLWRDWVQLAPSRLSAEQRKDVSDYVAVLQLITGRDANAVHRSVWQQARALQPRVTEQFACWAVTSLSARGRVPLEPGYFDLVVIDEASQCDIASALPLLYRAKRSVIIGDPQQLRHISALSRPRDSELQHRYGLVETRVGWMYSVASLYDAAAGVVPHGGLVNLRDHHRSHADIIGFANRAFYEGRLRVATHHQSLRRPRPEEPGVVWQDVQGRVTRPASGGARNVREAEAVIAALEDLLVTRAYGGSVGVVTPFRAQAQLLQQLVQDSEPLGLVREKSQLLVDTVHRFQGDERDVMLFSPVVSAGMSAGALGFLRSNGHLFNVAITRARALLHVVGDRAAAAASDVGYLAQFASYATELDGSTDAKQQSQAGPMGPEYPPVARPEQVSEWERVLYRAMHAAGIRAIPQFTVEQYDLDFAVIVGNRRLNIEVDGERYHRSWTGELCLRDQLRNQRLLELGWDIQRFWVFQVRDDLDGCVRRVAEWVADQAAVLA